MQAPLSYNALVNFQYFSIFALSLGAIYIFAKWKTPQHKYLFIYCFATLINNLGYTFEMTSPTMDRALIGTRFAYLGKVFIPIACFAFIMEYCNVKINKRIYLLLCLFHLSIFFMVLTGDSQQLYHYKYAWETTGYFAHLEITHGPFYFIYIGLCILYLVVGYYTIYKYYKHVRNPHSKQQIRILILSLSFMTAGFIIYLFGLTSCYDATSMGYTLSVLFMYIALFKFGLMDTKDLAKEYALDNISAGIIAIDDEGDVSYYNEIAKNIFSGLDFAGPEFIERLDELVARQETIEKDGHIYMPSIHQLFQNDMCTGILYTLSDETTRIEHMKELEAERDKAEDANQSKTRFLNVVSHELRTPMNAVVGMTDLMLKDSNLTDKQKKYLSNIKSSGQSLVMIVNDLLDQSKLEAGKMELVEEPYELAPMLSDVKMIIENRIGTKPIQLIINVDERIPQFIIGDGLRIRQILINLMNNAVKFTEDGYIIVGIELVNQSNDDLSLRFAVKDSGQGIRPEDLSKLGQAFAQVDTKKNHNKEGTGLGLSISKDFIALMGGQLEVKSTYGAGSEFFFTIKQKACENKPQDKENEEDSNITFDRKRVLVVDDTPINLEIAEEILHQLGITVDTSISGGRAIEMVKHMKYDMIFMDYMMPNMDGVEVTTAIRALGHEAAAIGNKNASYLSDVPIIGLTGDSSDDTKEKFLNAGVNGFTDKPLETSHVIKLFKKWFQEK